MFTERGRSRTCFLTESLGKITSGAKMEMIRNFLYAHGSCRQQHFRPMDPGFPNIGIDGHAYFGLEFACQIVFCITCFFCKKVKCKLILRMGIDIVAADTDRAGYATFPPDPIDTANKIIIHSMADCRHLADRLGSIDTLSIGVT